MATINDLKRTPWGTADDVNMVGIVDGERVFCVSTPSHGGYYVPTALLHYIPQEYQDRAERWSGSPNWYEEDCEWASVAVTFPQLFPTEALEHARLTITWRTKE